jgi:hypothetical protein
MLHKRWRYLLQIKDNLKKIKKDIINLNWKTRYNNLNKKYQKALSEIETLSNSDNGNLMKYATKLKHQRDMLRLEAVEREQEIDKLRKTLKKQALN